MLAPGDGRDIRAATGHQPLSATAPVVMIYVADRMRMPEAPAADPHLHAPVDAALVAQNVYLFAAAEGPGTVVLGTIEKPELARTLKRRPERILTFIQPVGCRRQRVTAAPAGEAIARSERNRL